VLEPLNSLHDDVPNDSGQEHGVASCTDKHDGSGICSRLSKPKGFGNWERGVSHFEFIVTVIHRTLDDGFVHELRVQTTRIRVSQVHVVVEIVLVVPSVCFVDLISCIKMRHLWRVFCSIIEDVFSEFVKWHGIYSSGIGEANV
jgi:hypothetical protein